MQNWITNFMEQFGYVGIALIIALENVFPPIPSEIVLPFGGFMTTNSSLTVIGVIIAATIGSVAGAVILYGVGLLIDVERLEKIVDRWGHILRVKKEDIHRADKWFDKYGYWTVLFCRMVPLVRSLISIPAGMSNMKFGLFLLFTTIGTVIWNSILVIIGASLGENWHRITEFMDVYSNIAYAIIAVVGIGFIVWYVRRHKKAQAK
ncbi:DedA family protein [Paenibacillus sp. WLX1005]|uniref:DedA family protein n=1 Tax=Paenibacillus sp. WLX1005 TaxID=3243766 RepID=UPI00398451D0